MMFTTKLFTALSTILVITIGLFRYFNINQDVFQKNETPELKEQIGQMIMVGFRGTEASNDSHITNIISNIKIGGVILYDYDIPSKRFPRNIINPKQTKKLISDLQSHSQIPLLIGVDSEGGEVNRLSAEYGFAEIASAKNMGEDKSLGIVRRESTRLAEEFKELGLNLNFAPILDIDVNPKNPAIGALGRSFSSKPQEVINNAKIFIENHIKNNIIPVAKHFPGHGSSTNDSHLGITDVTDTYDQQELNPYIELQKLGLLDAIMTAHIINRNIDKNYPATLSADFLQKILRRNIGFTGVVISDDMQMNAITDKYGFEEAIVQAINAGCDIILLSNNRMTYDEQLSYKTLNIIYNAVKEGRISKDRIEESYVRIYNLKKKFGIIS